MDDLIYYEVKHPDIVLKQAILETGWFKSEYCVKRHNLFGFYDSKNKTYMTFNTWQESVIYYKNWQDKRYKGGDYYQFLSNIGYTYKGDTMYSHYLKQIHVDTTKLQRISSDTLQSTQ